MSRRHVLAPLAATASAIILTAPVLAQPALSIDTPTTTMPTTAGDDALPAGQGDPRFFHFSAPVTLTVIYG
jgi:hypothetical protein